MGSVNATLVNGAAATAGYPIDQTFLGHISSASTGTVALAVSSSNNLNFSSAGLSHVSLGAVGAATFSGMLTPAGSTYSLGGGGGTLTFASSLGGSSGLVVTGQGTVVLTASNTYGGGTTVSSGTLQAKTPGALPSYASSHSLSVAPGAVLSVNVGGTGEWTTGNLDSLLGNSTAFPAGSAIGIDTSDANGEFTYSSNINGNVGLCKFGAGTLVLTGSSGYAGATTVAVGTLNVGGQLTASEVSVQRRRLDRLRRREQHRTQHRQHACPRQQRLRRNDGRRADSKLSRDSELYSRLRSRRHCGRQRRYFSVQRTGGERFARSQLGCGHVSPV